MDKIHGKKVKLDKQVLYRVLHLANGFIRCAALFWLPRLHTISYENDPKIKVVHLMGYAEKVLKRAGMSGCNACNMPMTLFLTLLWRINLGHDFVDKVSNS